MDLLSLDSYQLYTQTRRRGAFVHEPTLSYEQYRRHVLRANDASRDRLRKTLFNAQHRTSPGPAPSYVSSPTDIGVADLNMHT